MLKVKGFGYHTEKDKDVIEHIKQQSHQANYVWSLVRKDMNRESIEELVKREIERYLKVMNILRM